MKPSEIKFRMYRHTDQVTKGDHFYYQVKWPVGWQRIFGFTDYSNWATNLDINGNSHNLHQIELTIDELTSARRLLAEDCSSLLVARLIVASRQAAAVLAKEGF